jgi:hypothetical protein
VSEAAALAPRALPVSCGVVLADSGLVQLGVIHLLDFVVSLITVGTGWARGFGACPQHRQLAACIARDLAQSQARRHARVAAPESAKKSHCTVEYGLSNGFRRIWDSLCAYGHEPEFAHRPLLPVPDESDRVL